MASLASISDYGDPSSDEDAGEAGEGGEGGGGFAEPRGEPLHHLTARPSAGSSSLSTAVVAAPAVTLNASLDTRRHLDPSAKEVKYNPR